ncbi:copper resistance protein B [Pontibacter sp. JAM-7]|uniref:copper resistance protein B n=1 Tax=Pontibacter sp. JAM-7 TaxID=3366581 RepID=UPI003AF74058
MNITKYVVSMFMLLPAVDAYAMGDADPLVGMVKFDQLEFRDASEGKPLVWEAEAWLGYDLNKVKLKTRGERLDGVTESAELQLLYSRAIDPNWDLQLGVRHDFLPKPDRTWGVVGVEGLAPWYLETDAALFIGESGQTGIRLKTEYELMLTQRLVLVPELQLTAYGKNDLQYGIGSGLSDLELGIRLSYEFKREFAPYIGLNWERLLGKTADLARDEGHETNDLQWVVGVRFWF